MTLHSMLPFRTQVRRMRLGALLAIGLAIALAGCASITDSGTGASGGSETITPGAEIPGTSRTQGTLAGDVVAGPTCPVERAEDACPPKAVPNREVQILNPNNAVAATAMTDSNGRFSVLLAPGVYRVIVPIMQGQVGMRQMQNVTATITAGQVTTVKIELDTGIR
jgi:hypothetical protein